MTGLKLNLAPECLTNPTPLDLDLVGAVMLWPNDQNARENAIQTSAVAFFRKVGADLSKADLVELMHLAADAQPLAQLQDESKIRFEKGVRAGLYLRETVGLAQLGRHPSMKRQAVRASAAITGPAIKPHTFENHVWPVYRCVAHFWAASLDLNLDLNSKTAGNPSAFPCALTDFRVFLARAEGYRELGEHTRAHQAPRTVLRPGHSIRLPDWFNFRIQPEFELAVPS